jgi:hypothetical protein
MKMKQLERIAVAACGAELQARGMKQIEPGILDREVAPGLTGHTNLPVRPTYGRHGEMFVEIAPVVGVLHQQTSRLVSDFLGIPAGAPERRSRGCLAIPLDEIMRDRPVMARPGWTLPEGADPGNTARRVADDVERYGFPYMERLGSASALLAELQLPRHRMLRRLDRAVLSMLCGRPEDARSALMEQLPLSQDPLVWADPSYGAFLNAFSAHFGVDLDIGSWPVREPGKAGKPGRINIRDRGVVWLALKDMDRYDLLSEVSDLDDAQVKEISARSTEVMAGMPKGEKDYHRAIGLAAAELMDAWGGSK